MSDAISRRDFAERLCPNGFGPGGLPTGLSLVARAFDEAKLVRIARWYQRRTDWHTRRPVVA